MRSRGGRYVTDGAGTTSEESTEDQPIPQEGQAGYEYYRETLDDRTLPCAFVDLDRLEANARNISERAGDTPVRIASKSVRSRPILERILDLDDGFRGIMCYAGEEARYLAEYGFDDLLIAYPIWQRSDVAAACEALADGTRVTAMVDSADHVMRLADVAEEFDVTLPLCLDIDLSTTHATIFFGVRRSGIRDVEAALDVCETIEMTPGVRLAGLMGYEAQLAGVPDRSPAQNRLINAVIRLLKRRSRPRVRERRGQIRNAIEEVGYDLAFVNGGGTGTVEFTTAEESVTEVTVGSGFYAPVLFDYYDRFYLQPAAGFVLEISRQPTDGIYTCRGGGYIASGPPGADREPRPWLPPGLELRDEEGAGEVQTPILYDAEDHDLSIGDPILFRHAKAGELMEQFEQVHLIRAGEVVETVPTYRGDGRCFL